MKVGCGREFLSLLLLLSCHVIDAVPFQFCLFFGGSCESSCSQDTFIVPGTSWCWYGKECCIGVFQTPSPQTTTPRPSPSACGIKGKARPVNPRVIGGDEANKCEFPWLVYVARSEGDNDPCGGAVIDERHILSAAHCFYGLRNSPELFIGEYDREESAPGEKFSTREYTLYQHPDYNPDTLFNDITVIKLHNAIDFSGYRCIRPLCLPTADTGFPVGTECIVAGWGVTKDPYNTRRLRKVTIPIVDRRLCAKTYGSYYNTTIESCAGQLKGSKDSCDGDSGGPLMCRSGTGEEYYAAGIVSRGAECAKPQLPAIYTDVVPFLPWIRSVIESE